MTTPAVMFMEMALDALKRRLEDSPELLISEAKEFHCLGPMRLHEALDVSTEVMTQSALTSDMPEYNAVQAGFLLGIETARMLLGSMPAAVQAGVRI